MISLLKVNTQVLMSRSVSLTSYPLLTPLTPDNQRVQEMTMLPNDAYMSWHSKLCFSNRALQEWTDLCTDLPSAYAWSYKCFLSFLPDILVSLPSPLPYPTPYSWLAIQKPSESQLRALSPWHCWHLKLATSLSWGVQCTAGMFSSIPCPYSLDAGSNPCSCDNQE